MSVCSFLVIPTIFLVIPAKAGIQVFIYGGGVGPPGAISCNGVIMPTE